MRLPRAAAALPLLLALAGCAETGELLPTCTEGRSRCVAQVSVGARFACAALLDRTVWCWGRNDEGQLGYPTTELCAVETAPGQTRQVACHTFPFQVNDLDHVTRVAAGDGFACALRDDGTVRCWGGNASGELGLGCIGNGVAWPVPVPGITDARDVGIGMSGTTCVVHEDGGVSCWGRSASGQLGPGVSAITHPTPWRVQGVTNAIAIAVGFQLVCALTTDGTVVCWGENGAGGCGLGHTLAAVCEPGEVVGLDEVVSMDGTFAASCAVRADGTTWCWGAQLGDTLGVAMGSTGTPVWVSSLEPAAEAVHSTYANCARLRPPSMGGSGDVRCWGSNYEGTIGLPTMDASHSPTPAAPIQGLTDAVGLTGGDFHFCARKLGGRVACWGVNTHSQLGDGTNAPKNVPVTLAIAGFATDVDAGQQHTCAVTRDGTVWCWGFMSADGKAVLPGNPSVPQRIRWLR